MPGLPPRFTKLDFRLGIRLSASAVLAMVLGRMLGLHAFYWAGISAIIVSTGSPGGSFSASLTRFGGTMLGLATGLLLVLVLGHTLLAAALAIPCAILACQAAGLKPSVKVAALSTLFPIMLAAETQGLSATWTTVLSRAENVLLGCVVTLVIDGAVWPERTGTKLQGRIRQDAARAAVLAGRLLEGYLHKGDPPLAAELAELQTARLAYTEMLKETSLEPEDPRAPRDLLAARAATLHVLVDHCAALRDIQGRTREDGIHALLQEELASVAGAFHAAAAAFGEGESDFPAGLDRLRGAAARLEAAYEGVRGEKGTQAYRSQEVFRLLGVLYHCGALARAFGQLSPAGGEAPTARTPARTA